MPDTETVDGVVLKLEDLKEGDRVIVETIGEEAKDGSRYELDVLRNNSQEGVIVHLKGGNGEFSEGQETQLIGCKHPDSLKADTKVICEGSRVLARVPNSPRRLYVTSEVLKIDLSSSE
ncbi:MAG: hypothetical protein WDZ82_00905 [Candidatus Paceibacterota bacterium]